ncbi:hypothetical protein RND81_04G212800 [Saponaria officinalis]|uniref:DUF7887 domain-containing protein n=1 Tax=Saponaria officinalis TaxID=3572 RepID=A0AAW1LG71_SAPOF
MMLICGSKSLNYNMIFHLHKSKITTKFAKIKARSSNSEISKTKKIIAQSAIAVLGLGFLDAGYSGDWSRIGVISNETEDVLKFGAFLVVPLCVFLIITLSKSQEK